MKEIIFSKDGNDFVFDFYFKYNAHILMTLLGGIMVSVFALFYSFRSFFSINDETYFLFVFFIAATLSVHFYKKYNWLSLPKRIRINSEEVICYYAGFMHKSLRLADVMDIVSGRKTVIVFPLTSIVIVSDKGEISIEGFKKNEDVEMTLKKLKEIILRKNPE